MVVFPVAIHTASFGADHVSFGVAAPPKAAIAERTASSVSGNDRAEDDDETACSSSPSSLPSLALSLWPYFALSAANESSFASIRSPGRARSSSLVVVFVAVASSSLSSSSVNALSSRSSS